MISKGNDVKEKDVVNCAEDTNGIRLTEDDIVIRKFKVNFAMGDKNPFERVKFYSSTFESNSRNNYNIFFRMLPQGYENCKCNYAIGIPGAYHESIC